MSDMSNLVLLCNTRNAWIHRQQYYRAANLYMTSVERQPDSHRLHYIVSDQ